MRSPGDRRARVRFEVFGAFWGTLDISDAARVIDLTPFGALIESRVALAVESIQSVSLVLDNEPAIAEARVRHLRSLTDQRDRYLVGLEFISPSAVFLDAVDRLIRYRSHPSEEV